MSGDPGGYPPRLTASEAKWATRGYHEARGQRPLPRPPRGRDKKRSHEVTFRNTKVQPQRESEVKDTAQILRDVGEAMRRLRRAVTSL
jgi:hypothetical protein